MSLLFLLVLLLFRRLLLLLLSRLVVDEYEHDQRHVPAGCPFQVSRLQ
jgi:hypothetical protein